MSLIRDFAKTKLIKTVKSLNNQLNSKLKPCGYSPMDQATSALKI